MQVTIPIALKLSLLSTTPIILLLFYHLKSLSSDPLLGQWNPIPRDRLECGGVLDIATVIGGHCVGWGWGCRTSYSARHSPKQAQNFNSNSTGKWRNIFQSPHSISHQVHIILPSKHMESSFFLLTATALIEALMVA